MLQELCKDSFFKACTSISSPLVKLKGRSSPFVDFYGDGNQSYFRYNWHVLPLNKMNRRRRELQAYRNRQAAWIYFNENADKLREHYLRVKYSRDLRQAMIEAKTFDALFQGFSDYFEERKSKFMEETNMALEAKAEAMAAKGKHPQSHGGVANLLKVLTKTMHDQGASIYTIAKVQYAVCMQAGIYIPDDFLTDVLVAHEMIAEV